MKYSIVTFGCKVNQYEAQVMRETLGGFFTEATDDECADVVLVNTCSVTAEADRQSRQAMRRARKKHPHARVIAAGCYARRVNASLIRDGLADRVVDSPSAESLAAALDREIKGGFAPAGISRFDDHSRVFVKVQDGCDRSCSFCVVPLVRGESVSRPAGEVVAEIGRLVECGAPEVVLCGVRLNAYRDAETCVGIAGLVKRVLAIESAPILRVRLSSLYPGSVDPELIDLVTGHPRVMKHLHLPVQSGSDSVLKAMGRGYVADDVVDLSRRLKERSAHMGLTADILVGYPTETDADFERTLAIVEECEFHKLHRFPFSPRPGTRAEHLRLLPAEVVKERMERLARLEYRILAQSLKRQVGRETDVVVEGKRRNGDFRAITDSYHSVRLKGVGCVPGNVTRVKISGVSGGALVGVVS